MEISIYLKNQIFILNSIGNKKKENFHLSLKEH